MNKIIFLVSFICLFLNFYDYKELNDLAIINATNITYNNKNFEVSLEVVNPNNKEKDYGYVIYKEKGYSIDNAYKKLKRNIPKKLYLKHMGVLIIDEGVFNKYLDRVIDYFSNNDFRDDFYVFISKDKNILYDYNSFNDNILNNVISNKRIYGNDRLISFKDLLYNYINNYEYNIPYIYSTSNNTGR